MHGTHCVPRPTRPIGLAVTAPVLVTGAAGFIGAAVAARLLDRGERVIGVDNLNAYYDPALKRARLARLRVHPGFVFERIDVTDEDAFNAAFRHHRPNRVAHLAAQAGVRHSLSAPRDFVHANVAGTLNVLEAARAGDVEHLVYASTSAVYGANTRMPFSAAHGADHPLSLYAASKRATELMAHAYAHLFAISCTGLRFFTVYGPWGRPDMALFVFARRILAGEPIDVFNRGNHRRDFTYIDDIVEGVVRVLDQPAAGDPRWRGDQPDPSASSAPHRVYNLGAGNPVELNHFIGLIEKHLGRRAVRNLLPLQPGDVPTTAADIEPLAEACGYRPSTPVDVGVERTIAWFKEYHGIADRGARS